MRRRMVSLFLFFGCFLLGLRAQASFLWPKKERVEAPRFEVPDQKAQFPLRTARHSVEVVGPMASVEITQVYHNDSDILLEPTYVFPGSPRSAVTSLVMRIGERTVKADLQKRADAVQAYEQARKKGYRGSLLEQDRPNVFKMSLTNVRPGESVEVTLGYTELLVPVEGRYELTIPAVVAPRYGAEGQIRAVLAAGSEPAWTADVRLANGLEVTEISSPTHAVAPQGDDEGRVQVQLATAGDAEFALRWKLAAAARPRAGLTLYAGPEENFFMAVVSPPRVAVQRVPQEMVFVFDVSGSMQGFPMDVGRSIVLESLKSLGGSDTFNILFFAGSDWSLSPKPLAATPENIEKAIAYVGRQQGGGGTELVRALAQAGRLPRSNLSARTIVVITDGLVSFEKRAFAKVRSALSDSALFTMGIGRNVNRHLIEGLARAGGGTSFVAYNEESAKRQAKRLTKVIGSPLLTDLRFETKDFDVFAVEPPSLSNLYFDQPVTVVGKYRGEVRGQLLLTGLAGREPWKETLEPHRYPPQAHNHHLRTLWARKRLQRMSDDRYLASADPEKEEVTQLGLKYGLLTQYTAFVAIDSAGGTATGPKRALVQPGPHPQGMARTLMGVLGSGMAPSSSVFGSGYGGGGSVGSAGPNLLGTGKGATRIVPGKAVIKGSLPKSRIVDVIRRNLARLRQCYKQERLRRPTAADSMTLQLEIDPTGRVVKVVISESTLRDQKVEACVARTAKTLRFPKPKGGGRVTVRYPLTFSPS